VAESLPIGFQVAIQYRRAHGLHMLNQEVNVMQTQQHVAQDFFSLDEVTQIAPRKMLAGVAATEGIKRLLAASKFQITQVQTTIGSQGRPMPR
jgi:hypothetical protein